MNRRVIEETACFIISHLSNVVDVDECSIARPTSRANDLHCYTKAIDYLITAWMIKTEKPSQSGRLSNFITKYSTPIFYPSSHGSGLRQLKLLDATGVGICDVDIPQGVYGDPLHQTE